MRLNFFPVSSLRLVRVILAGFKKTLHPLRWPAANGELGRALRCLAIGGLSALMALGAPAQTNRKAASAASSGGYANACSIAEFRTLALSTHDPRERGELVTQWLKANASTCSASQILLISSNRAQWLGTSNSVQMAGLFDQIIEGKLKNDPLALKYMYGSGGAAPAGGQQESQ